MLPLYQFPMSLVSLVLFDRTTYCSVLSTIFEFVFQAKLGQHLGNWYFWKKYGVSLEAKRIVLKLVTFVPKFFISWWITILMVQGATRKGRIYFLTIAIQWKQFQWYHINHRPNFCCLVGHESKFKIVQS